MKKMKDTRKLSDISSSEIVEDLAQRFAGAKPALSHPRSALAAELLARDIKKRADCARGGSAMGTRKARTREQAQAANKAAQGALKAYYAARRDD